MGPAEKEFGESTSKIPWPVQIALGAPEWLTPVLASAIESNTLKTTVGALEVAVGSTNVVFWRGPTPGPE